MIKAFAKIMQKLGEIDLKNILIYIGYFFLPAITNSKGINISYDANGWVTSWYLLAVIIGIPFFVKGGFKLSFYGGLKMYDLGGLRIDQCQAV